MYIHVHMHHWVKIWIYVGIVCGAVALVNIFGRRLSDSQVDWILAMGALNWVVGGLICYFWDAVEIYIPSRSRKLAVRGEHRYGSGLVARGHHQDMLPPWY